MELTKWVCSQQGSHGIFHLESRNYLKMIEVNGSPDSDFTIEELAQRVQRILAGQPVVVLGTGASIPHGLPSMAQLAEALLENIELDSPEWTISNDDQPLVVTPGVSKYRESHKDPFRTVMTAADQVIREANCYLCVGYGFNDEHVQTVIRRLLPDTLCGFAELLPILDIGEALVVGDAAMLPSRIRIDEPTNHPDSGTVDFWDQWAGEDVQNGIPGAVEALRKQQSGA